MVKKKSPKSRFLIGVIIGILLGLGIELAVFFYTHPSWVGEQPSSANYVHKTLGLISDFPHMSGEVFYITLENLIGFVVIYVAANKKIHKEHAQFDQEHGIIHDKGEDK